MAWIRQSLFRGLSDKGKAIRIPVHLVQRTNDVYAYLESKVGDFITDQSVQVDEEATDRLTANLIAEAMQGLTEQQKNVLTFIFGLEGGKSRSLGEVGKEIGLTREGIRQIERKALEKLRHPEILKQLRHLI